MGEIWGGVVPPPQKETLIGRCTDTSDPGHFGPTKVRTQDTSALDSTYIEDQSHCILCKGLPVNRRE